MSTVEHRGALARRTGALCALLALNVFGIACDRTHTAPAVDRSGATGARAQQEGAMANPVAPSASGLAAAPPPAKEAAATATAPHLGQMGGIGLGSGRAGGGYAYGTKAGGVNGPTGAPLAADEADDGRAAPRLDPNARYATTYRPGGAALAAFDAALDRGSIPASYKDLVSDFGARYAPSIAVPEGQAMAFQVDTERALAAPEGGPMNLRISMRSTDAMPPRAQLSVHLVLDVSGSMAGVAIANARAAAEALVDKLDPEDDFSMVTFSNEAQVLVQDGPIGPRRAFVRHQIEQVYANGGTNISAGLDLGYQQAHRGSISPDAVRIVMLLSDGHANAGDTSPASLAERSARAFQDGIQTSSFGLGADFDAPLMSSFADRGAGGYYYLADSSQIGPALSRELDARLVPAAQAVEVRVRLRPDVAPTKVFGSRQLDAVEAWQVRQQEVATDKNVAKKDGIARDRQTDAEGGMRFFMPAFARDDRHAMMLTLALPPGVGERSIASVEIKYKDRIAHKNVTQEIPVHVKYATSDAESADSTSADVEKAVQAFAAGDAILAAAARVNRGDRAGAAALLSEQADVLKTASATLNEPSLGDDGVRLARLASAVSGTDAVQDPVPLAVLLRGSGYGYLQ